MRGRTYHDVKNCIPFNMTSAILHNTSTSWEQVRYGEFARPISQSGASMRKWVWLARLYKTIQVFLFVVGPSLEFAARPSIQKYQGQ